MDKTQRSSDGEAFLHDRCTNDLLNEIRTGRLQPRQRLSELAMSKKLKVGRAAIRVAFDRLAWAGLLERIPRSGTYVRKLTLKEFNHLMEVRARLEGLAASLACQRLSLREIARLEKAAARLDDLGEQVDQPHNGNPVSPDRDYAELQKLELAFHGGLARGSGNPYIGQILSHYHMLERSFLLGMSIPAEALPSIKRVPQHREIVRAMRKRVPELAEQAVLKRFRLLKESLVGRVLTQETGQSRRRGTHIQRKLAVTQFGMSSRPGG
jgi:DNA-binding GntR family transcriptional regulator